MLDRFQTPAQATAHAELLEQLRRLVEEGRAVKVLHGKQVSAALGGGGNDLWRVGFKESFGNEVFSAELEDLARRRNMAFTCALRKSRNRLSRRVSTHLHGVRDPNGSGASARAMTLTEVASTSTLAGRGLAFLDLGRTLEGHGAGELKGGFSGHALDCVEGLFAHVVRLEEHLSRSRSVSKVNEADGALPRLASMKPMTVTSVSTRSAPLAWSSPRVWVRYAVGTQVVMPGGQWRRT